MKILYYDCFAGISGDMNLGALVDLGVPSDYLIQELKKLEVEGYEISLSAALKMGISGTKADVQLSKTDKTDVTHPLKDHHGHHAHRNLADIRTIIESSALPDVVKSKSIEMFTLIAEAEAKIHSKTIDTIHFHEVGALDSIVDIVGAAICIDYLKPDKIIASTIELGGGFVTCAHGTFPVPAPATIEILKKVPVKKGAVNKETTTPTGAAILKVFVDEYTDQIEFQIKEAAYGIGHRDLDIPNVLRVYLGETSASESFEKKDAIMVACNIDDMNPEYYEYVLEKLFQHGAYDVFMTPLIMKKSRPAIQLNVLCNNNTLKDIERIILTETTSLGIRYNKVTKSMLERSFQTIDTAYGPIKIKKARWKEKTIKFKAEYDDCTAAAKKMKVKLQDVYDEVEKCMSKMNKES